MLTALVVASFVGVLAIFLGTYWMFVLRPEAAAERALRRRLRPQATKRQIEPSSLLKRVAPLSTVPAVAKVLTCAGSMVKPVVRLIDRSGLRVTVGQLVLGSLLVAAILAVAAARLIGHAGIAFVAACAGGAVPYLVVRLAAQRRLARFEEQFPEAIDLIARALRAGHALTTGLGMVAEEAAEPVRSEFALLHDRQNYGMPLPEAFRSFGERVPLLDARFFATAVLTQREAGGNLAEVLDNLATLIRERFKLKRQVRVLSAHGRITGWILGVLPFVIGALLYLMVPDHIMLLFTDPLGHQIVAVSVTLQIIGVIAIRKIVDIEI